MAELIGVNNEEKIWNYLILTGYTVAGVAAIMGYLFSKSGLSSNNLENKFSDDLGSDTYYTAKVNDKSYTKDQFINDNAGYGLAQWAYYTRKRSLYEMTVEQGLSIADLGTQLTYLVEEINSYSALNDFLKTTYSINDASDAILKVFENSAIKNYNECREFSLNYYNKYYDKNINTSKKEISDSNINNNFQTYKINIGDSWWNIASRFMGSGSRMVELAAFNNMNTDTILHDGDIIKIPVLTNDDIQEDNIITDSSNYTIYTVNENDSWWSIAYSKLGNSAKMYDLAKFNNKTTKTILHNGDKIKIPCMYNAPTAPKYTTYTVKKNETWKTIASDKMGSGARMHELAKFNGKTVKHILRPGNVIRIPK